MIASKLLLLARQGAVLSNSSAKLILTATSDSNLTKRTLSTSLVRLKQPSEPTTPSNKDETQVTKKDQPKEFVNYNDKPGYKNDPNSSETYLNPLLTPPPRSPSTPEDFRHPQRLGHWVPFGFDYTSPVADKYYFHEYMFGFVVFGSITMWLFYYRPDYKYREWAKREAFLRTAKREALGLPLIEKDVVDPERIVLPTEEEIGDYEIIM